MRPAGFRSHRGNPPVFEADLLVVDESCRALEASWIRIAGEKADLLKRLERQKRAEEQGRSIEELAAARELATVI